jgi:uncharacterized protein (UPF0332 family)
LLTKHKIETHTHAGAKQKFGLHFIKPGLLDAEIGKYYSEIFSLRQASDYDYTTELQRENVDYLLGPARKTVLEIEKFIKS